MTPTEKASLVADTRRRYAAIAQGARAAHGRAALHALAAVVRDNPRIGVNALALLLNCSRDVTRDRAERALDAGLIRCPVRNGRRIHRYTATPTTPTPTEERV